MQVNRHINLQHHQERHRYGVQRPGHPSILWLPARRSDDSANLTDIGRVCCPKAREFVMPAKAGIQRGGKAHPNWFWSQSATSRSTGFQPFAGMTKTQSPLPRHACEGRHPARRQGSSELVLVTERHIPLDWIPAFRWNDEDAIASSSSCLRRQASSGLPLRPARTGFPRSPSLGAAWWLAGGRWQVPVVVVGRLNHPAPSRSRIRASCSNRQCRARRSA